MATYITLITRARTHNLVFERMKYQPVNDPDIGLSKENGFVNKLFTNS